MGKDLKGKELGKGLGQRKDKYYYAKYSYHGKKGQQSFHTLVEAKNWRQEQHGLCRQPELAEFFREPLGNERRALHLK